MRPDLAGGDTGRAGLCQKLADGRHDRPALAVPTHPAVDGRHLRGFYAGVVALDEGVTGIAVLQRLGELQSDVCQHGGEALDLTVSTGSPVDEAG